MCLRLSVIWVSVDQNPGLAVRSLPFPPEAHIDRGADAAEEGVTWPVAWEAA